MKKTKQVIKYLSLILIVVSVCSCTQKRTVKEQGNKLKAVLADSLDITISFREDGNIETVILENKKRYTSHIWSYHNDGITPVLSGKEVNGQRDGLYLTFYPNGFLNTRSFFSKGELNGYLESYSEDGKVIYKALYEKGIEKTVEIQDSTTFEPKIK